MNERAIQLNVQGCKYLSAKDYISAYKYFAEAARLGEPNAIYNLGYCFFNGYGVAKNYEKAFNILKRFLNTNSEQMVLAAYLCGVMLDDGGYGIRTNKKLAADCYRRAAEKGHSWSMFKLGRLALLNGEYETARQCIETAMETAPNDYELQQKGKFLLRMNKLARFGG